MEILKSLSTRHSRRNKIGAAIFLILGFVGFLDAGYLAFESSRGSLPSCNVIKGCEQVLLSDYAKVGPIPLSYLGVIYYSIIIFGTILYYDIRDERILHAVSGITLVGILASAYFVFLQLQVLNAICVYCMFSALTSTLMFANGLFVFYETEPDKPWHHKISSYFKP